jgi:hypothetical protein
MRRLDASNFQQREMEHGGLLRERAETECESSVQVCVGMHASLLLIDKRTAKHSWPRTRCESLVSLSVFLFALEVAGHGKP